MNVNILIKIVPYVFPKATWGIALEYAVQIKYALLCFLKFAPLTQTVNNVTNKLTLVLCVQQVYKQLFMLIIKKSVQLKNVLLKISITPLMVVLDVINVKKVVINALLVAYVYLENVKSKDSALKEHYVSKRVTPKAKYAPLLMNLSQWMTRYRKGIDQVNQNVEK